MGLRKYYLIATTATLGVCLVVCNEGRTQGRGKAGGGGGGVRSAGSHAAAAPAVSHSGPAMTRPAAPAGGVHPGGGHVAGKAPNMPQTGGVTRPNVGGGNAPAVAGKTSGFSRPVPGNAGGDKPKLGGGVAGLPKPGGDNRPGNIPKPGGNGASSNQVSDFLGIKPAPGGTRPPVGNLPDKGIVAGGVKDKLPGGGDQPGIKDKLPGKENVTGGIKNKLPGSDGKPDINVGNVNIGNSVDYSKDQKAWVNNRHTTGNQVRLNSGTRYNSAYTSGLYRRGVVGGYPYYGGWANRGPYYGWKAATFVGFGAFMGATWANTQPVYYAYGDGGNVYYDNNTVYVNDTASGTPEQYAEQVQAAVAAAPATTTDSDWLPLGAFALSREDVDDSQTMIELAVNKEGIIAGTYYNEATGVSRSLKGTVDRNTQRVAIGFADGKGGNIALETGIYNLTQDEAPGMLHLGKTESQPVLLVRLNPPEEKAGEK